MLQEGESWKIDPWILGSGQSSSRTKATAEENRGSEPWQGMPDVKYYSPGNQFERFRGFLELIRRFEFDFRRRENYFF